jgi:hypothetical protein
MRAGVMHREVRIRQTFLREVARSRCLGGVRVTILLPISFADHVKLLFETATETLP